MKRLMLLLVVLAVLIGVYFLVQSRAPVVDPSRPFVDVDSAKVVSLGIQSSGERVELSRDGDAWKVTSPWNAPAATKTIQAAVGRFKEMKRLSLITEKPDRFGEFQVDDNSGVKVTVGDGKKKTTFYLGKVSSAGNSYARLDGSNEVWEIAGNQTGTFKRKAREWRDKMISEVPQGDFQKLTFRYPGVESLAASRQDTFWNVDAGKQKFIAGKGLVERVTGLLSRLSCADFADSLGQDFFNQPVFELIADLNGGVSIDLKLMPKDENQYYLRKAGATTDYVIYKSTADVLMKSAADFKEKPSGEAAVAKPKGKKS